MDNEEYRECIGELLEMIDDNKILKRIFVFVHRLFIRYC